jgi:hypothetical protein
VKIFGLGQDDSWKGSSMFTFSEIVVRFGAAAVVRTCGHLMLVIPELCHHEVTYRI